jgi:hypothetical protein
VTVVKRAAPVLCSVLLAVFPVVSLFTQNQTEVELSLLWPSVAVCAAGAVLLFGLFLLISKDGAKAGVLASVVVVGFLYYGLFFDQQSRWFLALWLALVVVGVVAVLRTRHDVVNLTLIVGVAAAVMVVPQATSVVRYRVNHPPISASDRRLWPTALDPPVVPSGATLPDIYVLIPDDFARLDVLKQYFDYDDSNFVAQLEQRGFAISKENHSPYSYSELNMAAMLNLDYLTNWPRVLSPTSQDFNTVKRVIEDSRAARLLSSIGYDYAHLDTDEVTFAGGNPGISPFASPDSFGNLWLGKSILRQVGGPLGFNEPAMNERFRTSVRSEFSELRALRPGPRPKFVVFHTLIPHDPFVFGARGESVTFPAGADHTSTIGMEYYVGQLEYLQQQLLDSIDQILANAVTPPVIVLQADEGFEMNPDLFGEEATQDIRVKGIGAYYLPGLDPTAVSVPPNTVNALRFVFNQYLGTNYEILDSVSHLEGDFPYTFEEIPVR